MLDDDFFDSGVVNGPSLSYGQLDKHARSIAARLHSIGSMGDRVLLLFGPGLEFMPAFFGCLYAGMIPVPTYPPVRGLELDPLTSVRRIVKDCDPRVFLTGGDISAEVQQLCEGEPNFASIHRLNTNAMDDPEAERWQPPYIDPQTIALLQYTSGSTGSPRGVMVTHDNIMKNEYIIQLAFNHMTHRRPGVGVCWLPFHHDMGLMGCVLQSVFVDGPCYFMSPLQFLRKPVRWLQAISHLAPLTAYASGGPNFAFELCVRKVKEEHKATLDLSSWEIACVGAETVSPGTLERFGKAFAPCGFNPTAFFPSYGLAEATLLVTGGRHFEPPVIRSFVERDGRMSPPVGEQPSRQLVSSGRPWLYQEVVIVDPESARECPPGRVGEIWISGPCVAKGYWNRPEETDLTFNAFLEPDRRGPFLRTGDLGFFDDGELFISGRLKDLIIIRGRNYYPDDIECTVRRLHEAFAAGSTVALGYETGGEERLVILQEIDRGNRRLDKRQLTILIRQTIAEEHQLHAHDIRLLSRGTLPKTTSGKVQRFASRELYAAGQLLEWTEPENE